MYLLQYEKNTLFPLQIATEMLVQQSKMFRQVLLWFGLIFKFILLKFKLANLGWVLIFFGVTTWFYFDNFKSKTFIISVWRICCFTSCHARRTVFFHMFIRNDDEWNRWSERNSFDHSFYDSSTSLLVVGCQNTNYFPFFAKFVKIKGKNQLANSTTKLLC